MSKTRLTGPVIAEFRALGYGSGYLADYRALLQLGPSWFTPESTHCWLYNPSTERQHDVFARTEKDAIVAGAWAGGLDMREQFPAWPEPHAHPQNDAPYCTVPSPVSSRGVLEIAADAKIDHPRCPGTRDPLPITVDAVIAGPSGAAHDFLAVASKGKPILGEDSSEYRALEILELQRRWTRELGGRFVQWIPRRSKTTLLANLRSLFGCSFIRNTRLAARYDEFLVTAQTKRESTVSELLKATQRQLGLSPEDAVTLHHHAVWKQHLLVDLRMPWRTTEPTPYWTQQDLERCRATIWE